MRIFLLIFPRLVETAGTPLSFRQAALGTSRRVLADSLHGGYQPKAKIPHEIRLVAGDFGGLGLEADHGLAVPFNVAHDV